MKKLRYFLYFLVAAGGAVAVAFLHLVEPGQFDPASEAAKTAHTDISQFYPGRLQADLTDLRLKSLHYSQWQEGVKAAYTKKLAAMKPELLVLPFETQLRAVDKIGRSLMARHLIRDLKSRSDQVIPGFDMVDRAFGFNRPRFTDKEIQDFLDAVEPDKYVRTYVGHKGTMKLYVTVYVFEKDPDHVGAYRETGRNTWERLPFSDEHLPTRTFADILDDTVQLILPNTAPGTSTQLKLAEKSESTPFPATPLDMVGRFDSDPAIRALSLQTLGVLTPETNSRERHRLFERSLMNLQEISPSHPHYPLLKARALIHLGRRPAALFVLNGVDGAEAEALRQNADANLASFAAVTEQIEDPWRRLLARVELNQLAQKFDYANEFIPTWADDFYLEYPQWRAIVETKLNEGKQFGTVSVVDIKRGLDEFLPRPAFSLNSALAGFSASIGQDELELALMEAIANHIRDGLNSPKLGSDDELGITGFDYLHFMEGSTIWAAIMRLRLLLDTQVLPGRAAALARQYLTIFEGEKDILFHEMRANSKVWVAAHGVARDAYKKEFPTALARTIDLAYEHDSEYYRYQRDLNELKEEIMGAPGSTPQRSRDFYWRTSYIKAMFPPKYEDAIQVDNYEQTIDYVHHQLYALWYGYLYLKYGDKPAAKALWERNRNRFEGHRRLSELRIIIASNDLENGTARTKEELYAAEYQRQVNGGSIEWKPYFEVAKRQMAAGKYQDALETFNKFPGFLPGSTMPALWRTNYAAIAASELFWRGAYEQAIPLYEIGIRQSTGAESEMRGNARIATIRGDYVTAIQYHYMRGTRYNSEYGFRDSMSLLHVLGESDQAWALFDSLSGHYNTPAIWDSALVGHRVANTSREDLEKWIFDDSRQPDDPLRRSFLQRYALIALTMDRAVDNDLPTLIERVGKGKERKRKVTGIDALSHGSRFTFAGDGVETVSAFFPNGVLEKPFAMGDVLPSELSLFASGYNAIKNADYERAFSKFLAVVRIYGYGARRHEHHAFPYLARAASKAGKLDLLHVALVGARKDEIDFTVDSEWFDYHLAQAFISAGSGDHDTALRYLDWAFGIKPFVRGRPVMPWFQMVEASLWLYEDSGDPRYLSRALSWARRYQTIAPMYAWASAVVGRYSDDADEKRQALGIALFLDPQSHILSNVPERERQAARAWFDEMRAQGQSPGVESGNEQPSPEGTQSSLRSGKTTVGFHIRRRHEHCLTLDGCSPDPTTESPPSVSRPAVRGRVQNDWLSTPALA